MISLGLTAAQLRAFHAQLITSHRVDVSIELLNLNHDRISVVSNRLLDGQVNADYYGEVSRSCSLTLLDQDRSLSFDSDSPADTAFFLDRMVRVTYSVFVDALNMWVRVPVFTGPITKLGRDGDTVNVEAQGKEVLASGSVWRPITLAKGMRKTTAITTLLRDRAGETRFSIPALSARLPNPVSLDREGVAWSTARSLAGSMSYQLFYDGRGTCCLRTSGQVLYTWDGASLVGPLQIDYGEAPAANTILVKGATPKGQKTPITYTLAAPSSDPLSPWRLGRNGIGRYLVKVITDDNIRTTTEARTRAERELASELREHVSATFNSLPVPHLEPGDLVRVVADEGTLTFGLTKFSLPLVLDSNAPMTVGYLRNVATRSHRRMHR